MRHTLNLDISEDVFEAVVRLARQTGREPEAVAVALLTTASRGLVDDPLEQ